MSFFVKTNISECGGFEKFLSEWRIGESDLILTNEYVLTPQLDGKPSPCDVLYQEKYGGGEPSDEMVDAVLEAIESKKKQNGKDYERVVAIGGGTVIDVAKLSVFGEGLRCQEIFEKGATLPRKRRLLVIPTTCGTGSEVTNISIVAFKKKQTKMGLAIPALFPDEAVLIGDMLRTLPYEVFATSSVDALIHAMESHVSPKADVFTRTLGEAATRRILKGYIDLADASGSKAKTLPRELQTFLTASTMAGIAFGNAGVGAVHALSYPLGAIYHVPHGKANALVFKAVFEAYQRLGADLSPLEEILSDILNCPRPAVWEKFFELVNRILAPQPISELGVDENKCAEMAQSVIQGQQRLLNNNPIPLSQEEIETIYRNCL
ncbi:MAG: iron-containing alcohol dehydrogenase [Synergistaceae bacterium]|jgi:4-hydroxybutyrate dehydrogenase|nr:iron-containing alcohol dehydrogenase [Synergistaceae bacterium]